jgi:hypothetical protein
LGESHYIEHLAVQWEESPRKAAVKPKKSPPARPKAPGVVDCFRVEVVAGKHAKITHMRLGHLPEWRHVYGLLGDDCHSRRTGGVGLTIGSEEMALVERDVDELLRMASMLFSRDRLLTFEGVDRSGLPGEPREE